ncbi:hypothetical protein RCL1_004771 [Eukaryota sp. TZLM3-RCL]
MTLPLVPSVHPALDSSYHSELILHPSFRFHLISVFQRLSVTFPHLACLDAVDVVDSFLASISLSSDSMSVDAQGALDEFLHDLVYYRESVLAFNDEVVEKLNASINQLKTSSPHLCSSTLTDLPLNSESSNTQFGKTVATHLASADQSSRKTRRSLPSSAINVMTEWFNENSANPYPSEEEKTVFQSHGITLQQINTWFSNKRRRSNLSSGSNSNK